MDLTQQQLDAFFSRADRAIARYPVGDEASDGASALCVELTGECLAQLQRAIQVHADELTISCHCLGTVSLELLAKNKRVAMLTFHLHLQMQSVWLADHDSGVRLADSASALLQLLAARGMPQPLEVISEAEHNKTRRPITADREFLLALKKLNL